MLRVSVIGAGPMGRLHARAVARRASKRRDSELAFIVDRHEPLREAVAKEFGGTASAGLSGVLADAERLSESDRAVAIVAVPTAAHAEITQALLAGGVDVLLEKPMTGNLEAATRLVEQARTQGRVFAVGHVEWFNPTLRAAWACVADPRQIVIERMNPESPRGLDIDVVQDFMLHDLDWLRRSVASEVTSVEASGRVAAEGEDRGLDVAEATLLFACGVRARVRASRVHDDRRRRIEIEGRQGEQSVCVDADLLRGEILLRRGEEIERVSANPSFAHEGDIDEPLDQQLADFVQAVEARTTPANDGQVGVETLALVERIRTTILRSSEGEEV